MIACTTTDANALPTLFWFGVGIPIGGRYFGLGPARGVGASVMSLNDTTGEPKKVRRSFNFRVATCYFAAPAGARGVAPITRTPAPRA